MHVLTMAHVARGADKIQEMDDLVWANANSQLNLTHILEPIFHKVQPHCPYAEQGLAQNPDSRPQAGHRDGHAGTLPPQVHEFGISELVHGRWQRRAGVGGTVSRSYGGGVYIICKCNKMI